MPEFSHAIWAGIGLAGGWHIVVLNSSVSTAAGSPQDQWLEVDLAAHPTACTLAYWHLPRFYSGWSATERASVKPLWSDLYAAEAEVVLNAHTRHYERFAPQDPNGAPVATEGGSACGAIARCLGRAT